MRGAAIALSVILLLALSSVVLSYSGGPPDRRTGAPGESDCSGCHQNLNTGGGSIWLTGPKQYQPGDTLLYEIHLSKDGQQQWGFELTILNSDHNPIGTILRADSIRTQLSLNANGRTYLKHTLAGTDAGVPDAAPGWQFLWVAPNESSGPANVYACGNAADASGDIFGDHCYTLTSTISLSGCCVGTTGNIDVTGIVDLTDLSLLIAHLTAGAVLPCPESANIDTQGITDLSDLTALIRYLTVGDYNPPACP